MREARSTPIRRRFGMIYTSGNSRRLPHIFAHKEHQLLKLTLRPKILKTKTLRCTTSRTFKIKTSRAGKLSHADIPAARHDTPSALSTSGVKSLVKKFGLAAKRCDEAGFDVLDVQAAHGYLIHSFLSPLSNFRTDEYGGSQKTGTGLRLRLLLE